MAKTINMECPICKKKVLFVGVHDDEGNYHGLVGCEYENDPWSGLSYALHHEGWGDCPMCTDGAYSTMGGMLFDTAEDAIPTLTPPNEWVSVDERLPGVSGNYICAVKDKNGSVWTIPAEWSLEMKMWIGAFGEIKNIVTHWMPLPAAPDRRPPEGENHHG